MATLLDRLGARRLLVADGAWGTRLQERGLEPGECPELWNVTRPQEVRRVADEYLAAGSDLILTNTFGGSPLMLRRHGLEQRTEELNEAGARLSLEAASSAVPGSRGMSATVPPAASSAVPGSRGMSASVPPAAAAGPALVAASVGPTGELPAPLGTLSEAELEEAFRRQARAILRAGVRIFCVETMIDLTEACCAVRAARSAARELGVAVEVMATLTYGPSPSGYRTAMGVDIPRTVEALTRAGADVLGSNCGNGIEQMLPIAAAFRALTSLPLLVQANAGLPVLEGGRTVFRQGPEDMARHVPALVRAGVSILGGCCGTGPAHIAALRRAVDAERGA
jgi:5-methyltetrahydrofolate--homocysteine methyltransferase